MPKIFALRHQLQEQQAKLKQQAKNGSLDLSVRSSSHQNNQKDSSPKSSGEDSPSTSASVPHFSPPRGPHHPHPYYAPPPPPPPPPPPASLEALTHHYQRHLQLQRQQQTHQGHLPLDLGRPTIRATGRVTFISCMNFPA